MSEIDLQALMCNRCRKNLEACNCAALPPVRSEPMLANQMIVMETIHRLLRELQDRYPVTAEIPREEVFAWLDSRTTHWFANIPLCVNKEGG